MGGIMTYDVTDPMDVRFQSYVNNRDFEADPESPEAGDLAPEGLKFIAADKSPTGRPMLAVANEASGTTTVYEVVPRNGSPAAFDALFDMEEASGTTTVYEVVPRSGSPVAFDAMFDTEEASSKRRSSAKRVAAVDLLMTLD
jgi:hypothetical protein